jgi:hypothetical protein
VRENLTHGPTGGGWRPGMVGLVRHRQTKGAATDRPDLQPLAPASYPTRHLVQAWRRKGHLPAVPCNGRAFLFRPADVEAIAQNRPKNGRPRNHVV